MHETLAIILAAGLGTRMKSRRQKGLHLAAGRPLISYPIQAALEAGVARVALVVGHQADEVEETVRGLFPGAPIEFVLQAEQKGTAHATLCARAAASPFRNVLLINGDLPLLPPASFLDLFQAFHATGGMFALQSAVLPDPAGFGRIVRDLSGAVAAIVEEKDATTDQRALHEVNVGVYAARTDALFSFLEGIGDANAGREFYFTDIVKILRDRGHAVGLHVLPAAEDAMQVNDRPALAEVERLLYLRHARRLMSEGVTIHQPETVMIDLDCRVGPDTEIFPGVEVHGGSRVGGACTLGRGCVLTRMTVGDNVLVKPYCVLSDSVVEDEAQLGPFAHLRPGSVMRRGSHVGNFVEMKKTDLGPGSKANHLTYLGDSTIGARVNVGAGCITCNYDGVNKLPTTIEDGAFIGSDCQLVAPVKVGKDAYVAAGTTVTKEVPPGALAISRVPQTHVMGYAERKRKK